MSNKRFLQIHHLTAYPSVLLNRDDVGLAKRVPFGGVSRIRISSQCLKRHWRMADDEFSLKNIDPECASVRSRYIFAELIAKPLIKEGLDEEAVNTVVSKIKSYVLGEKEGGSEALKTEQLIVLGMPEIDYIKKISKSLIEQGEDLTKNTDTFLKTNKENFKALKKAVGVDAAMFGRMVTSDILSRGDGAVYVSHSFTVHPEEVESDYFTAVDDLQPEGELGSAHMNTTELTSGLFYGYVVVDIPQLIKNLSEDEVLAAAAVHNLVHLIATVSPGAKKGSTAPFSFSQFVLAEAGNRQPRTLANAFLKPVINKKDILSSATEALSSHLQAFDDMYGKKEERKFCSMSGKTALATCADDCSSLKKMAEWCRSIVSS